MAPAEIEKWLDTDESKKVGFKYSDGKESVGHYSGRRIIYIKRKALKDLSEADYEHMRKVIGYAHRHLVQRPKGRYYRNPMAMFADELGHYPK